MKDLLTWVGVAVVIALVSAALGIFIAFPVMWLWNAVIPSLFGLKAITWIEALCLYALCDLLFKSHTSSGGKK